MKIPYRRPQARVEESSLSRDAGAAGCGPVVCGVCVLWCWVGGGEGEGEGSAFAGRAGGPDLAAVAFHDLAHAREADAGAGELAGWVQPLERAEQLAGLGGVEAGAVVADVAAGAGVPVRCGP